MEAFCDREEKEQMEQMLRVNYAGEKGAVRIYEGQLWGLKKDASIRSLVEHMLHQEKEHAQKCEAYVAQHQARPSLLMPLWNALGFGMGALTALLSENAAMACTVAVEEEIEKHYENQEKKLEDFSHPAAPSLKNFFEKCREEEIEHKNWGLSHGAKKAPYLLKKAVGFATRFAICVSEKI